MSRSLKKSPFVAYHLLKKINKVTNNKRKDMTIITWSRASTILPSMVGFTISVYNGKQHVPIFISDQLIGHKLENLWLHVISNLILKTIKKQNDKRISNLKKSLS